MTHLMSHCARQCHLQHRPRLPSEAATGRYTVCFIVRRVRCQLRDLLPGTCRMCYAVWPVPANVLPGIPDYPGAYPHAVPASAPISSAHERMWPSQNERVNPLKAPIRNKMHPKSDKMQLCGMFRADALREVQVCSTALARLPQSSLQTWQRPQRRPSCQALPAADPAASQPERPPLPPPLPAAATPHSPLSCTILALFLLAPPVLRATTKTRLPLRRVCQPGGPCLSLLQRGRRRARAKPRGAARGHVVRSSECRWEKGGHR
jgi:hypothetical protein